MKWKNDVNTGKLSGEQDTGKLSGESSNKNYQIGAVVIVLLLMTWLWNIWKSIPTKNVTFHSPQTLKFYNRSTGLTVIFDQQSDWEKDFVLYELVPAESNWLFPEDSEMADINFYHRHDWLVGSNIFVISSNGRDFRKIREIVLYLRPLVIIHLSDEHGTKPEYMELAKFTNLLVRQHSHVDHSSSKYGYSTHGPTIYMPLGYFSGMFEGKNSLDHSEDLILSNRSLVWSFIGNANKQDRPIMVETMKVLSPHRVGRADPSQMRTIYENSIFTPNGRGNVKLDCFRLYEASACGSIPIVVGSKGEINSTFGHFTQTPPWIFAESWPAALGAVKKMLEDPLEVVDTRRRLLQWWREYVLDTRSQIAVAAQHKFPIVPEPWNLHIGNEVGVWKWSMCDKALQYRKWGGCGLCFQGCTFLGHTVP